MRLTKSIAIGLQLLLLVTLLIGTQMPGEWRDGLQASLHAPFGLSSWAHYFIFMVMAGLARLPPLAWPVRRILLVALVLGLTTEVLQIFAIHRHPGLDDVAIDMAGAATGLVLVWLRSRSLRVASSAD